MTTAKQAAAGPRTSPGKTASRYNPLKHGINAQQQIMFDEAAEDLADLTAEYHEHHSPADSAQRLLVDTLVHNEWRLRRMRRVEAVLWEHAADSYLSQHPEAEACNSAHAFITDSGYFERLQRMVNGCERNYHRALKELQRLKVKVGQALPPANTEAANPEPPQPEQSKTTSAKLASFRQNPKTPPAAAPQPPPVPPFAAPATPADIQPSASDRHPKPPQTA